MLGPRKNAGPTMPTESPLLLLSLMMVIPGPKLDGPEKPVYRLRPVPSATTKFAMLGPIAPVTENPPLAKVSPVKLMAPLPVPTTLDPTCSSVTVKPWAARMEKSDVTAIAKSVSGRSFLGKAFMTFLLLNSPIYAARQPTRVKQNRAEKLLNRHQAPQPVR